MTTPPGDQVIELPLQTPPEVVCLGFRVHGVHDLVEHYLLPELYAIHIYDWTGGLRIGDALHAIQPGDMSIIPPGVPMEYRYRGPSHHLYAHFRLKPSRHRLTLPAVQPLGPELSDFRSRLGSASTSQDRAWWSAALWSVLWEAAAHRRSRQPGDQHHEAALEATRLIETNLASPLRVSTIARAVFISPSHLNRLFHAEYGLSVSAYVRELRATRAEHLLKHTTLTIASIASSVGITDVQAFNKFCHARFGTSPSGLRSAHSGHTRTSSK